MIDEEDYMDKIKYQIELNKLLVLIKPEHQKEAVLLYNKKINIMKRNNLLADWQLRKINKRIDKLKIDKKRLFW